MLLDLRFRLSASSPLPRNNGYFVFSGVSNVLGGHLPPDVGVFPIGGRLVSNRVVLTETSSVGFRCPTDRIPLLLGLVGKEVAINDVRVRIGTSQVYATRPQSEMFARMVTFKGGLDESTFLKRANYDLQKRGIQGEITISRWEHPPKKGDPKIRIVEIDGKRVVGFSVKVSGLSDTDAQRLIDEGMGGRRHMGCGLFVPAFDQKD